MIFHWEMTATRHIITTTLGRINQYPFCEGPLGRAAAADDDDAKATDVDEPYCLSHS